MEKQAALDLLEFIHESPTNFHAVLSIKQRLQAHGFKQLFSGEGGAFCMPNIIEITDFHAPELDPYARLTQNQATVIWQKKALN